MVHGYTAVHAHVQFVRPPRSIENRHRPPAPPAPPALAGGAQVGACTSVACRWVVAGGGPRYYSFTRHTLFSHCIFVSTQPWLSCSPFLSSFQPPCIYQVRWRPVAGSGSSAAQR